MRLCTYKTRSPTCGGYPGLESGSGRDGKPGLLTRPSVPDLRPVGGEVEVRALLGDVAAAAGGGVEARHRVRGGRWGVGAAAAVAAFAADVFQVRGGGQGAEAGLA